MDGACLNGFKLIISLFISSLLLVYRSHEPQHSVAPTNNSCLGFKDKVVFSYINPADPVLFCDLEMEGAVANGASAESPDDLGLFQYIVE
jgi:hypothetical protein